MTHFNLLLGGCNLNCLNGGILNSYFCTCQCQTGFSGYNCAIPSCSGLVCLNGGYLNSQTCTCNCVNGYTGYNCATGKSTSVLFKSINWALLNSVFILAPCNLVCQNGGYLNSATCQCTCPTGYSGLVCQNCEFYLQFI